MLLFSSSSSSSSLSSVVSLSLLSLVVCGGGGGVCGCDGGCVKALEEGLEGNVRCLGEGWGSGGGKGTGGWATWTKLVAVVVDGACSGGVIGELGDMGFGVWEPGAVVVGIGVGKAEWKDGSDFFVLFCVLVSVRSLFCSVK